MRAVWITRAGGPEVLAVRESADPQPDRGEVRIAVRAAGLNFAEVMARQGLYPDAPKPPCVVGYEVSGVVDALGAGVTGLDVAQRVLALVRFGGHADTVCAPAERVLPMPDDLSFTDGAALPVNYLTAYHMLFRVANLRPQLDKAAAVGRVDRGPGVVRRVTACTVNRAQRFNRGGPDAVHELDGRPSTDTGHSTWGGQSHAALGVEVALGGLRLVTQVRIPRCSTPRRVEAAGGMAKVLISPQTHTRRAGLHRGRGPVQRGTRWH
jgi:alcohol dehydrogenase-like protein